MRAIRRWLASVVLHPRAAMVAALLVAAASVAVGLAIPQWLPLRAVEEGGPVETVTLYAYGVAVLGINLARSPQMSGPDRLAASVVLLAMGAREADLHKAMYGVSILKSRFYLDASPDQVLGALLVLAPIACAVAWLLHRNARRWLRPWTHWSLAATTVAVMVGALVVAKVLDRAPMVLGMANRAPAWLLYVMLALEEMLELSLPLFALLAAVQSRAMAPTGTHHAADQAPSGTQESCGRRAP